MPSAQDPFQNHLARAAALFDQGEVVQAGQIWQAILKRDPAHREARAGLYRVKLALDRSNGEPDPEVLLQEGCTLFDLGQVRDALEKWERILAFDPRNRLALAYANDARRELGLALLPDPSAPARPEPPADAGRTESADLLVREAVQIYDLGMVDEAVAKWERALALDPNQQDAPAYLAMARRDREAAGQSPTGPPPAAARPAVQPGPPPVAPSEAQPDARPETRPEAPPEPRAEARPALPEAHAVTPRLALPELAVAPARHRLLPDVRHLPAPSELRPPAGPAPVDPPAAVTGRGAAPRGGFRLPGALSGLAVPLWLRVPKHLTLVLGLLLAALLGLVLFGAARREAALKAAVAAAKNSALKPVSRMIEIPALTESAEAVHQEAERALPADPLMAYLRALEWVRLDPDNPAAAELAAKAKDKLGALPPAPEAQGDFLRLLQSGDLDDARLTVLAQLRQAPDDPELRARARQVVLALVPRLAVADRLDDTRDALLLGRALFPQDKIWQAKLRLLEAIQGMPRADRAPWIQLLG